MKTLSHHFEKKMSACYGAKNYYVKITISLKRKQKQNGKSLILRTFIAKFLIFIYFSQKSKFQTGSISWRHNYVTPWLVVIILVWNGYKRPSGLLLFSPFSVNVPCIFSRTMQKIQSWTLMDTRRLMTLLDLIKKENNNKNNQVQDDMVLYFKQRSQLWLFICPRKPKHAKHVPDSLK